MARDRVVAPVSPRLAPYSLGLTRLTLFMAKTTRQMQGSFPLSRDPRPGGLIRSVPFFPNQDFFSVEVLGLLTLGAEAKLRDFLVLLCLSEDLLCYWKLDDVLFPPFRTLPSAPVDP